MDQESSSSEPRERAVSSEPCSTRPNPFDDGDISARKRRRTSLSGSRSASVDTLPSREDREDVVAASDSNIMKVDTPEPPPPSTPAPSEPPNEPVSSKVTINLRNADSLEATPASPSSPTPARFRKDSIKDSVEESEVNMAQATPVDDTSSSTSELDSPEAAAMSFEDELTLYSTDPNATLLADGRAAQFSAAMLGFPYHTDGEAYYDTVARLVDYFRQRVLGSPILFCHRSNTVTEPSHVDEALQSLNAWLNRYLTYAHIELYPMVMEVYQENKLFWNSLPDLFYTIAQR